MKFFIDHLMWVCIALISGGALLLPYILERGLKISVFEAVKLMNKGKALVLDVRTAEVFAKGHIADAKNIDIKFLRKQMAELDAFKASPVIVVCESGKNAMLAVVQLKKSGFTDVASVDGGLAAWRSQGLPLVGTKDNDANSTNV